MGSAREETERAKDADADAAFANWRVGCMTPGTLADVLRIQLAARHQNVETEPDTCLT
jgi:hypothetical protein